MVTIFSDMPHLIIFCIFKPIFKRKKLKLIVFSIIMEFADGGDLFQKVNEFKKKGVYIKEKEVWDLAIQMLRGIKFFLIL